MRRAWMLLAFCVLAWVPPATADPRPYLDLDFEMPECTGGWNTTGFTRLPYENSYDRSVVQSGGQSVRFTYASPFPWSTRAGAVSQARTLGPELAGKRVRLSGSIRTEGLTAAGGYATLFWAAFAPSGTVYADTFQVGARGTTPWTRYEIEVDVPADSTRNLFGVQLFGNGTAWFDNLKLEIDGEEIKQGPMPNLAQPAPGHAIWLRDRVIPFDTAVAGNGFADLQPLKQILGDARIVSLGEATHGTREFFQMKHRLLEFLVEEMGFTHFSIEASMPEAYRLNDFVLHGVGDPEELLEGMYFWTWNTQEVLDMVLWMRAYNASGRGPVQFTGFDMQYGRVAAENVRAFLAQAEPAYLPQAEPVFARIAEVDRLYRASLEDRAAAQGLLDHMTAKRAGYVAAGLAAEKVDWAIQNARILWQLTAMYTGGPTRDESMAENAAWILDNAPAGSKIVLWAHNGHVAKQPGWMGSFLAQRYGDDM
ncbi:MAG TPA: erythromycin esterase family protein, partial [Thermoanaerobaculia bacterium]|nr:erythromycin esterase family protein [Thermoanaerobaculia bacterium]